MQPKTPKLLEDVRDAAAFIREVTARLMTEAASGAGRPVRAALLEFLVHGVKYAFPPERGLARQALEKRLGGTAR